mmetsp:Transcript_107382/g.342118  ORF Transcript_107382/g.342118 Transcript_107382/m.342118 type:complete len:307 (+) Transcript_107382:137-1057(+)
MLLGEHGAGHGHGAHERRPRGAPEDRLPVLLPPLLCLAPDVLSSGAAAEAPKEDIARAGLLSAASLGLGVLGGPLGEVLQHALLRRRHRWQRQAHSLGEVHEEGRGHGPPLQAARAARGVDHSPRLVVVQALCDDGQWGGHVLVLAVVLLDAARRRLWREHPERLEHAQHGVSHTLGHDNPVGAVDLLRQAILPRPQALAEVAHGGRGADLGREPRAAVPRPACVDHRRSGVRLQPALRPLRDATEGAAPEAAAAVGGIGLRGLQQRREPPEGLDVEGGGWFVCGHRPPRRAFFGIEAFRRNRAKL